MTSDSPRIVLALPAYNESANIDPLFTRIADARAADAEVAAIPVLEIGAPAAEGPGYDPLRR